jgi:hypothetical protein
MAELMRADGKSLVKFPLDVASKRKNGEIVQMALPLRCDVKDQGFALVSAGKGLEQIHIIYDHEWIEFTYVAQADTRQTLEPMETIYFARDQDGMQLKSCIEGFAGNSREDHEAEENYQSVHPSCDTRVTYCTPPPTVLSIHMPAGWFSIGLTRLPDSKVFEINWDKAVVVDQPSGHLKFSGGQSYTAPPVFFFFPSGSWDSLSRYRQILLERNIITDPPIETRNLPEWWKYPLYVTYGDQVMELQRNFYQVRDWDDRRFNCKWTREKIEKLEQNLGNVPFNVIIDAYWQNPGDFDPTPSERFAEMKELIAWCHGRGHKVLLWCMPFITAMDGNKSAIAKKHKILKHSDIPKGIFNLDWFGIPLQHIDYTSASASMYLEELCKGYFSVEGLNADGLKLDFTGSIADPATAHYARPEMGMGMREAELFCTLFDRIARKIKKDVCLNYSAADVRFTHIISMNRLHDIHVSSEERFRRARISATASPNTIIDSDGAVMHSHWLEEHYLNFALIGTCSLYYSRQLQDGIAITDEQWGILRNLLGISTRRPWGQPVCLDYRNWQLLNEGEPIGQTIDSRLIMMFTQPKVAEVVSLCSETIKISSLGRTIINVEPQPAELKLDKTYVQACWQRGVLYKLTAQ